MTLVMRTRPTTHGSTAMAALPSRVAYSVRWQGFEEAQVTPAGFAIFCLVGFLLPVPVLAWLDRRRAAP